ncbi:helix-turn-helix transcriptional regulator [Bradyrhizobium liaoningense]|uniref:helix-turn-helix transcriptional regulator n=1 Tax=Bradyrhizobium liaoningense TaxID=43992 RepID=UPI001FE2FFBC|nr:helix-turn-helix transcriptional regulator [Bradyrhizobium liaoningense]
MRFDFEQLERSKARLGEAVLDPGQWISVMEDICFAAATSGAGLLQSDVRTSDVPVTPSVKEAFQGYFAANLHVEDVRAIRGVPLLLSGRKVLRDQDLFSSEREMLENPLYRHLGQLGFQWWSAISFQAGPALWALALQRKREEGAFEEDELKAFALLSEALTEAATLSHAVGRQVLLGSLSAFDSINEPALSMTSMGRVLELNAAATEIFDADFRVHNNRLYMRDGRATRALDARLTNSDRELRLRPGSRIGNIIVARRETKRPIVIKLLPVPGAARSPFLGARFILTFTDLEVVRKSEIELLSTIFALTAAEAKVARLIAAGWSPEMIADDLALSRETVRNQVKAVFSKTATHRQNELAALIGQMRNL